MANAPSPRDDGSRERRRSATAPERLFYGYVVVAACSLIQAVAWGVCNSFGVFFDPLLSEFGWLRATLSGAASLGFLVHGVLSIAAGSLNDRCGPRLIMTGCGLFLGTGYLLMAGITEVWHLYLVYGVLVGVGLSGVDVVLLSTVARWFRKRRGMMTGVIKMGTGVGMVVMPVLITRVIAGFGWRTAFAVLGGIILVAMTALSQLLVRDPGGKNQRIDNGAAPVPGAGGRAPEEGLAFGQAVRTVQFRTVCAVYFIVLFCVFTIVMHVVQHAIDLGIPAPSAAGILSVIGGVSIAGRLVMGGAVDRIGEKTSLLVSLLLLLAALLWLQGTRRLWMFYVFAAVYGFAHGGFFTLSSPLVARLFGTRSHGLLFGLVIFSSTVGGALGPVAAGHLFDVTRSYDAVFWMLALLVVAGLALTAGLKPLPQR